jgi:hypothetical protein
MGWFLLAHMGLPVGFGLVFLIFSAATARDDDGWDVLAEAALDLTILALGATGAVFDNSQVEKAFGSNAAEVAMAVIAINLVLSAVIVFIKSRIVRRHAHFDLRSGIIVMFVGVLAVGITSGTFVLAYVHARP